MVLFSRTAATKFAPGWRETPYILSFKPFEGGLGEGILLERCFERRIFACLVINSWNPLSWITSVQFERVAIEALGYTLAPEVVSSAQIESLLAPAYSRLRLPEGRLELMSGIAERRFWPRKTAIGAPSANSARLALQASGLSPDNIGCLIHASVCRDYLEPATACRVHSELGLGPHCWVYDLSNACLGLLSGMMQIATMIEVGAIRAGIVVGTESSRNLVESTIAALNADPSLTRQSIKPSFASLTIGSGSCAILLCDRSLSRTDNRLLGCVARAESQHHQLCQSDHDQVGSDMQPLMQTDSEQLLHAGLAVGEKTFDQLLQVAGSRDNFDATVCHQVGGTHRKMMLESLHMPPETDFTTFRWLGNTGSVALPLALALGLQSSAIAPGAEVALLGIGSGINSVMMATTFPHPIVAGDLDENAQRNLNYTPIHSSNTTVSAPKLLSNPPVRVPT
jgi:acyl-CoA:acyl-CoA alkyltransferase